MNQPNDNAAESPFENTYAQQPAAQQVPTSQPQQQAQWESSAEGALPPQAQPAPQPQYAQQSFAQPQYGYAQPVSQQRSRLVAGLLGIFLGWLGIHRFYLGYTTIGVIQLIVTIVTFGLAGLWGFIEGIMILARAQSFQLDADGMPLGD